jgi:hypothetical protein
MMMQVYEWRRLNVIIDNVDIKGLASDLNHLDQASEKLGFIRWQWEYYRATYDYKFVDAKDNAEYFLRVNARVTAGKLESPEAELVLEEAYLGRASFPHGLDYEASIPESIVSAAKEKLNELKKSLTH